MNGRKWRERKGRYLERLKDPLLMGGNGFGGKGFREIR